MKTKKTHTTIDEKQSTKKGRKFKTFTDGENKTKENGKLNT